MQIDNSTPPFSVIATQKNDGELVVSKNGKVVRVKAREFKKTKI
jgi:hypothetical protein